jgi:apolipoprotein N-acyltransferase
LAVTAAEPSRSPATAPTTGQPARTITGTIRRLGLSPLLAVAAGAALLVSFPPYGQWWAAPVGVALLALAVEGVGGGSGRGGGTARFRGGLGLGALTGATLFTPLLGWTNLHTGMVPWLLLSGLQTAYLALLGGAAVLVRPLARRYPWTGPLLVGLLWTAQEALRDRTPFGGFPWGRLAFAQGDSPLLALASLGGAPLVTFAVALCGGLLAATLTALLRTPRRTVRALVPLAAGLAVVALSALVPLHEPAGRGVVVAVVQGNVPRLGLDFNEQRRAVLDNHVRATVALADRVAAGRDRQPDLVIWPENSSDIDPFINPDAAAGITRAAAAIRAPILVGAVLVGPGENDVRNAGVVWEAAGTGAGTPTDTPSGRATGQYIKRHPVPFAEYVPLRRIARMVSEEVDRVRRDFVAGTEPGVLTIGPARVGDVICFEVAYDGVVRDTVTHGAQLIAVQTNNATFDTAEAGQQMAMVRLRAVEHGRHALMASTVGISGFVDAHGQVYDATQFNTEAVLLRELRLGSGRTLATRLGAIPEYVLVGAALAALAAAMWLGRRRPADRT